MAGIKNIRDLYKKIGEKGLREILEKDIRVTEKFDAYRFAFEKNPHDYKIYFYGKNGKSPLSKIDRTVNDLYEAAITYIENLPADIKRAIPARHRFGFSWFPSQSPLNTKYNRRPKHGLVLTDVTVRNRQWEVTSDVKDKQVFERWSNVLGVEPSVPVFEGVLDSDTVEKLIESAKTSEYQFESLNESQVHTSGLLKGGIEALVFESNNELFKISDVEVNETRVDKRSHLFDILLLDICEHISSYNIAGIKPVALSPDEAYIEIVSEIFNDFVDAKGSDFLASGLERPRFLEKSGRFNRSWVKNPKTIALVEKNANYEYLFTIFLTNLKKPKYPSGLLSEAVVNEFNNKIEEIDTVLGDDYSFLEFNSILREAEEPEKTPKKKADPDYEKGVRLLQTFFEAPRKKLGGKNEVNVLICNASKLSNGIISEAERLMQLNGNRVMLFHNVFQAKRGMELDDSIIRKMLDSVVSSRPELFVGYKFLSVPLFSRMFEKLGEEFKPLLISYVNIDKTFAAMDVVSLEALYLEDYTEFEYAECPTKVYAKLDKALDEKNFLKFKDATPECIHAYWNEIYNAFETYTYL